MATQAETANRLVGMRIKPSVYKAVQKLADENASTVSRTAAKLVERQLAANAKPELERR